MPLDPRLVSSNPSKVLENSKLKFLKETNIDYADSFKKKSTEPPFTINRFDESDLRRKIQAKKPKLNPRLSFITEDNAQEFELFTGVGRFDSQKQDLYSFENGRPNTKENFTQYPDYKPVWADLYFASPTVEKRSSNPMPSVRDPDPQGIIMSRAEAKAEKNFEDELSVAQLLNPSTPEDAKEGKSPADAADKKEGTGEKEK